MLMSLVALVDPTQWSDLEENTGFALFWATDPDHMERLLADAGRNVVVLLDFARLGEDRGRLEQIVLQTRKAGPDQDDLIDVVAINCPVDDVLSEHLLDLGLYSYFIKQVPRRVVLHHLQNLGIARHRDRLLNELPNFVYERDVDGKISFCNRAFAESFRRSVEEIQGKLTIRDLYWNPAHADFLQEELVRRGGAIQNYNLFARRPVEIGSKETEAFVIAVHCRLMPLQDGRKTIVGSGMPDNHTPQPACGYLQCRHDGKILFCSERMAQILGRDSAFDIIGNNAGEIAFRDDSHWQSFCSQFREDAAKERMFELYTEDRRIVCCRIAGRRHGGNNQDSTWYEATVTPEDMFWSLVQNSFNGIYMIEEVEGQLRFTFANRKFEEIFGLERDGAAGLPLSQIVYERDLQKVENRVRRKIAGDTAARILRYDFRARTKSNGVIRIEVYSAGIQYDGRRAVLGYVRRAGLQEKEELRLRASAVLTAGINHIIGNALGGLRGGLERLERRPLYREDDDFHAIVKRLRLNTDRIRNGIAIVKSHAAGLSTTPSTFSIKELFGEVREFMAAKAGNMDVSIDVADDLNEVTFSRGNLLLALENLVSNALEAILSAERPAGAEAGKVVLRARRNGSCVEIEIEDNGPGITPENADHLFEPFYTTRKEPGMPNLGLGLAVAKVLIEDSNGEIEVATDREIGARFTIQICAGTNDNMGAGP